MGSTVNLNLTTFDITSGSAVTFQAFRLAENGESDSNMTKIDSWSGSVSASIVTLNNRVPATYVPAIWQGGTLYTATGISLITTYNTNQLIDLVLDTTNTSSVSLNINGLGTKTVQKVDFSGSLINVSANDLRKNKENIFRYNGASWVWVAQEDSDSLNIPGTSGNLVTISASNVPIDSGVTYSTVPLANNIVRLNSSGSMYQSGSVIILGKLGLGASTTPTQVLDLTGNAKISGSLTSGSIGVGMSPSYQLDVTGTGRISGSMISNFVSITPTNGPYAMTTSGTLDLATSIVFNIGTTFTGTNQNKGIACSPVQTSVSSAGLFGIDARPFFAGISGGPQPTIYGLLGVPTVSSTATQNVTNVYGGYFRIDNASSGSSVISNGFVLNVEDANISNSGSVTNMYGLRIASIVKGTASNYSIYSDGGKSYFKDSVGINTPTPKTMLDVGGPMMVSANNYIGANLYFSSGWKTKAAGYGGYFQFSSSGGVDFYVSSGSGGVDAAVTPIKYLSATSGGDVYTDKSTFTPVFTNLTVTGTPIHQGYFTKIGKMVWFDVHINPNGGTVASTMTSTYFTLQTYTPSRSGVCSVAIFGQNIGNGLANTDLKVYCPTWTATGNEVIISGWYPVA